MLLTVVRYRLEFPCDGAGSYRRAGGAHASRCALRCSATSLSSTLTAAQRNWIVSNHELAHSHHRAMLRAVKGLPIGSLQQLKVAAGARVGRRRNCTKVNCHWLHMHYRLFTVTSVVRSRSGTYPAIRTMLCFRTITSDMYGPIPLKHSRTRPKHYYCSLLRSALHLDTFAPTAAANTVASTCTNSCIFDLNVEFNPRKLHRTAHNRMVVLNELIGVFSPEHVRYIMRHSCSRLCGVCRSACNTPIKFEYFSKKSDDCAGGRLGR